MSGKLDPIDYAAIYVARQTLKSKPRPTGHSLDRFILAVVFLFLAYEALFRW
jgi:hypothetical protein